MPPTRRNRHETTRRRIQLTVQITPPADHRPAQLDPACVGEAGGYGLESAAWSIQFAMMVIPPAVNRPVGSDPAGM